MDYLLRHLSCSCPMASKSTDATTLHSFSALITTATPTVTMTAPAVTMTTSAGRGGAKFISTLLSSSRAAEGADHTPTGQKGSVEACLLSRDLRLNCVEFLSENRILGEWSSSSPSWSPCLLCLVFWCYHLLFISVFLFRKGWFWC